jgi:hypothetical protein
MQDLVSNHPPIISSAANAFKEPDAESGSIKSQDHVYTSGRVNPLLHRTFFHQSDPWHVIGRTPPRSHLDLLFTKSDIWLWKNRQRHVSSWESMLLTQPPVKSLSVETYGHICKTSKVLLEDNGITMGQIYDCVWEHLEVLMYTRGLRLLFLDF